MKKVIILGAGGHARVVAAMAKKLNFDVISCLDAEQEHLIREHAPKDILLANGLGSTGTMPLRGKVYRKFKELGYKFVTLVHPNSFVEDDVILGEGVQIMAGVVVQTGVRISANTIINTGAKVDHDCLIAEHVHISPGVILCGGCCVNSGTHIGAGATIMQGVTIGDNTKIGLGAFIIKDVPSNATMICQAAKNIATNE